MQTIQAQVSTRLLSKASRFFTGTLEGRIIEILQNARRAGATQVNITNKHGLITVRDNGSGIEDFSKVLSLGDSDWDNAMEKAEDPAGVGIFCLAPRQVTFCSGNGKICITEKAWTGEPIPIEENTETVKGTMLMFRDDPWEFSIVEPYAVFTGMAVTVDGKKCAKEHFCSKDAVLYPSLGCKIEVRKYNSLSESHQHFIAKGTEQANDVLVNFHGQVVAFDYELLGGETFFFLVDMTGDPTDIRMMLPARTTVIKNKALEELKAAIEVQAFRFIQKRGSHKLPFKEYKRAEQLGINLPKAEPVFFVGLLSGDTPEPVEVVMPKDFPLEKCYRLSKDCEGDLEINEANVHLLAATGKFKESFVPVWISPDFEGYSWADLPTVDKVEVSVGKELGQEDFGLAVLIAVESVQMTATMSDGKVVRSNVLMAVLEAKRSEVILLDIYVVPGAKQQLSSTDIWYHLGGWNERGDTYGIELQQFEEHLELFWSRVIGLGGYMRTKLLECVSAFGIDWKEIIIKDNGTVKVLYKDGKEEVFK